MMFIKAKFLEVKQLPETEDFAASSLLTVLVGSEPINLVGPADLHSTLAKVEQLTPLVVELSWRRIDLGSFGGTGRGKAYRLKAVRLIDPKELVS